MKLQINRITWADPRGALHAPIRLALVTDLHDGPYKEWLHAMDGVDLIAVAGDLSNRHVAELPKRAEHFLLDAGEIAPVLCSVGNHERKMREAATWREIMDRSAAAVLDNTVFRLRDDLVIGGFSSQDSVKDTFVLDTLEGESGLRLLLCHHPEYFRPWVQGRSVDLTLAGHAHGGQVRIFGQGLFAPGQGLFPRLTSGFYFDRRLFVSRGVSNHGPIPRINDPCELIILTLVPKDA